MTFSTITDAYAHYCELAGDDTVRTTDDLRNLIHNADLRYEDIDERFWELVFGDDGTRSWGYDTIPCPTQPQWDTFRAASLIEA